MSTGTSNFLLFVWFTRFTSPTILITLLPIARSLSMSTSVPSSSITSFFSNSTTISSLVGRSTM